LSRFSSSVVWMPAGLQADRQRQAAEAGADDDARRGSMFRAFILLS
jgi:hypothetical protein